MVTRPTHSLAVDCKDAKSRFTFCAAIYSSSFLVFVDLNDNLYSDLGVNAHVTEYVLRNSKSICVRSDFPITFRFVLIYIVNLMVYVDYFQ